MILSIEGEEATGKTSLAYTGPLKIVGFQFDMGAERALLGARYESHFKDLTIQTVAYSKDPGMNSPANLSDADITIYECPQPIQLDSIEVHGMVDLWNYFLVCIGEALRNLEVRTIVIDTMTMARRIKIDAYLESLQEKGRKQNPPKTRERLQEIEYGNPNGAIRDIYTTCSAIKMNLIAVHHLQDERQDGMDNKGNVTSKRTGKRILEGLNHTYRFVDVAIRMKKDGAKLAALWVKCGYSLTLEGVTLKDPTWDSLVGQIEMTLGSDRLQLPRQVKA